MTCPLPRWREDLTRTGNGNRGLYFNKYFDKWQWGHNANLSVDIAKVGDDEGKVAWIKAFAGKMNSNMETASKNYADRIKALAEANDGRAENYITQGPLVTGVGLRHPVENGFTWHHSLGVPYLPASSIKGMMRAWARDWQEKDCTKGSKIADLLGTVAKEGQETSAGALIVFDALPVGEITLYREVITPHDGGWRISSNPAKDPPADWISPVPIPYLAIKEGAQFQFAFGLRKGGTKDDLEAAFTLLKEALDGIGAGAKTSVGFGRMVNTKSLPLSVGDRVRISDTYQDSNFRGRSGRIKQIFEQQGKAELVMDPGAKKPTKVVDLEMLERE